MFSVPTPSSLKAVILLIFVFAGIASAINFTYVYNSSNPAFYSLESGTLANSGYNSTLSAYALNGTNTTGSYLSPVLDAGSNSTWLNLSLISKYKYGQDYSVGEADVTTPVNLTGNVFLMHFNNQSEYGENSTFFYDASGAGVNGFCAAANCPVYNTSWYKLGSASTYFSGSKYINISDSLESAINSADGFTVATWIYPASAAANQGILGKYNSGVGRRQFYFFYASTQKPTMYLYGTLSGSTVRTVVTTSATASINNWHLLVYTGKVSADTYAIYIDGVSYAVSKGGNAATSVPNSP